MSKPVSPVWTPGAIGTEGCQGSYLLHEGSGTTVSDLSPHGRHLSFVGSPTWEVGPFGAQLTNFTALNYAGGSLASVTPTYPVWVAALASSDLSGNCCVAAVGSDTANFFSLNYNSTNRLHFFCYIGGTTILVTATGRAEASDDAPHVLMGVAWSSADKRLYCDGVEIASSTTSQGSPPSVTQASIGYNAPEGKRPLGTGKAIAAGWGYGAVPDPAALAADWLSGTFSAASGTAIPYRPLTLGPLSGSLSPLGR